MSQKIGSMLDRLLLHRSLARWRQVAARAETADHASLRGLRGPARQIRREIDRLLHIVDGRLALPATGSGAVPRPLMADWAWRPEIWRGPISPPGLAAVANRDTFGGEATIFHDCARSELTIRQVRNTRGRDLAPFGCRLEVFRFDGSFLSLAIDLPPEAVQGLTLNHVFRLDAVVETERPIGIYARLNVRHGPNTEQVVRQLPLSAEEVTVEFDLAYTRMNEKRVERAWIDLSFEGPAMNQIVLRDLTMSRRPRAEL